MPGNGVSHQPGRLPPRAGSLDPTGISTPENFLLYQLDHHGLAVADLWGGGIIHQTVAGFLSTGSATHALVKNTFRCLHRGKMEAKNKGYIEMYYVEGLKEQSLFSVRH